MDKSIVQAPPSEFESDRFGRLRVVQIDGEPWFVASDVCRALGLGNASMALEKLEDDEKGISTVDTHGGRQQMLVVNEPGLYSLVMRSRKPEARAFKRWVTHEVLPQIRRTGAYTNETPEETMARALLIAHSTIEGQRRRIEEMEPKARFADAVAASDGSCLVGELAKMLRQAGVEGMGQNRLFAWLRENGYLGKSGQNWNVPTQRAIEQGLFRIKETAVVHADGHVTVSRTPKVLGKGQRVIMQKVLAERGE